MEVSASKGHDAESFSEVPAASSDGVSSETSSAKAAGASAEAWVSFSSEAEPAIKGSAPSAPHSVFTLTA